MAWLAASGDGRLGEAQSVAAKEAELWGSLHGERRAEARQNLFTLYQPFAHQLARRAYTFRNRGDLELKELAQLAFAGLLEAIDGFDPHRSVPFRAYSRRRIEGSIANGIAAMSELRRQYSHARAVRRERIKSLAPSDPSRLEPDAALQSLIDTAVGMALGFMLDEAGRITGSEPTAPPSNAYESLIWLHALQNAELALGELPERCRLIIRLHYFDHLGFEAIGSIIGVSKGRVSQLHAETIGILRQRLAGVGDLNPVSGGG